MHRLLRQGVLGLLVAILLGSAALSATLASTQPASEVQLESGSTLLAQPTFTTSSILTLAAQTECAVPPPTRYSNGEPHRKIVFVSGWKTNSDQSAWDPVKHALQRDSQRIGDSLGEDDFLYFSYSGTYECDNEGYKDYTRPRYGVRDTTLSLFADYEARKNTIEELLTAFPEDQFDIIAHSNGGVVSLYWAATSLISPVTNTLDRVNSITTLNSPLTGWPGLCGATFIPHPPGIISALPDAVGRVRVLTVANENDTVVSPNSATLPGVWRHQVGNFGIGLGNWPPCDDKGHGSVRDNNIVHNEITAAIWPSHIIAPSSQTPFDAGDYAQPRRIWVTITYPEEDALAQQLSGGDTENVRVLIGGRPAEVIDVEDLADILRMFRFRVAPPLQERSGLYDLSVAVGNESHTQPRAVEYSESQILTGAGNTATTLIFDVSGSMDMADPSGMRKIEAAQQAALRITRMIARENELQSTNHQAGVIAFAEQAQNMQPLTTTLSLVEQSLTSLKPAGGTNLAAGLVEGLQQMEVAPGASQKIMILLSDGVPTVHLDGRQVVDPGNLPIVEREVLEQVAPEVHAVADCLYIIGFGDPRETVEGWPSIDEAFLQQLANSSACGGYYLAQTSAELANLYIRLRHESTGQVVNEHSGIIDQGETTNPILLEVPANQEELHITLNWPGSYLELLLQDPEGRLVDEGYPGATLYKEEPPAYFIIHKPKAGQWQAKVRGVDVPEGYTEFSTVASTRLSPVPPPDSQNTILALGLVLIAIVVGGVTFISLRPGMHQTAGFILYDANRGNRFVSLKGNNFTIGRSRRNKLVLLDPGVSGHHAVVRRDKEGWVLSDLNSTRGTYVNEIRITHHFLRSGDQIRLGEIHLQFLERG